ncbi:MAG: ankyrin repeat domain-containing protein, partial [Acidobacteriota bacterium]
DALDNDGWTALHYAASAGRTSAVKELIDAKTDVNLVAKDGWTPMMMALVSGRGGVVENLLKGGAKIPAKSPTGLSALYLAARGRDLSAVRQMLAAGQPLDGRDEDEWTSLELASFYGDGQIVMELLRAGADASLKDKEGKTALDRAKENQDAELVGVLGGSWSKPKQSGGITINIPCPALGGTIETNLRVDGTALVVTTAFPRPLVYYFGGGNMNRAESAKKFTYEGSFVPAYYLDTDSNPKTGLKETMFDKEAIGSEYAIDYSQYGTSVTLTYKDSKGNERSKPVFANVLSVDIKKEKEKDDEDVDTSALGDDTPRPADVDGVLVTKVPLSLLALTPGKTIRVVSKIGSCTPVTSKVRLQ